MFGKKYESPEKRTYSLWYVKIQWQVMWIHSQLIWAKFFIEAFIAGKCSRSSKKGTDPVANSFNLLLGHNIFHLVIMINILDHKLFIMVNKHLFSKLELKGFCLFQKIIQMDRSFKIKRMQKLSKIRIFLSGRGC